MLLPACPVQVNDWVCQFQGCLFLLYPIKRLQSERHILSSARPSGQLLWSLIVEKALPNLDEHTLWGLDINQYLKKFIHSSYQR